MIVIIDTCVLIDWHVTIIQMQFVHLLELNLVKIIGMGSALKYSLNLDNFKQDPINQYQSEYLKNSDEQLILGYE